MNEEIEAALMHAGHQIESLQAENKRRADRCAKLETALREVLEFQSAKTPPTIHDWGRWRRVADGIN